MTAPDLAREIKSFGKTILVLQGGGALGAYQIGVIEALAEAGIEPDWVIGTSIGAINAAILAGNEPADRLDRLDAFWSRIEQPGMFSFPAPGLGMTTRNMMTFASGVPGFFTPNPFAFLNPNAHLGADAAGYYSTAPLRETLEDLIDFARVAEGATRLTVGASAVRDSRMHYFDSADRPLGLDHVCASSALPPAFPAVRIDGALYWDGGILSNTPIEHVFKAAPSESALVIAVQLWNPEGPEPKTITEVLNRRKDLQFASRADALIAQEREIQRLRHIIAELAGALPEEEKMNGRMRHLTSHGRTSQLQVVRLLAPALPNETYLKDIDFSRQGIRARREAGYHDAVETLAKTPWRAPCDPTDGLVLHDYCGGIVVHGAD